MKKILLLFFILIFGLTGCSKSIKKTENVEIVPTLDDKISGDSAWCASFQLVWNDMQDSITTNGVKMNPQPLVVDNLNKQTFKEDMISSEYIYKKFAEASPELKDEIIEGVRKKFNQKSEIINQIDFKKSVNPSVKKYIFYAMLYREFTYATKFDELEKDRFEGANPTNVTYFGIDEDSKNKSALLEQLEAYYYNDINDFAIKINTQQGDEVILVKKPEGATFGEIWTKLLEKSQEADINNRTLKSSDDFKMPKLSFNVTKEFNEIENIKFDTVKGRDTGIIEKAIQSIEFEIDAMGGRIKSEASMNVGIASAIINNRHFYLNDSFALFLKEKDKEIPYFAALIDDITKY